MLREKRKKKPTERRILDFLSEARSTGQIIDHLGHNNAKAVIETLIRLVKEGWVQQADAIRFEGWRAYPKYPEGVVYWEQRNNSPEAFYRWYWVTSGENATGIVAERDGDVRSIPAMWSQQELIEMVEHFREKTWFSAGDEQSLILLWREHYEPRIKARQAAEAEAVSQ